MSQRRFGTDGVRGPVGTPPLDAPSVRTILSGYRNRYVLIRDAVAETGATLRDEDLMRMSILELLTQPVLIIADQLTGAVTG
jgi:hypothetical protein